MFRLIFPWGTAALARIMTVEDVAVQKRAVLGQDRELRVVSRQPSQQRGK